MSSYFVGYMFEGDAARWHQSVAKSISDKFGTWKVHEKVPPHLTIFYPFDTQHVDQVENLLENWTAKHPLPGSLTITGFNHFDDTVIFADVTTESPVDAAVEDLQRALYPLVGEPRRGFRQWRPHATLAHRVPKETIRAIWEYVQTVQPPHVTLPFDNITLFKHKGERAWTVEHTFRMKHQN